MDSDAQEGARDDDTEDTDDDRPSAAAAKEEASKQATDPATWRTGGVGIDP
jgi:hypothetical protein